ncbi:hypothetical protein WN48_06715 [Eufriesea mexicana]|uniref:Uncharacterized protein n=1 Tax=Eufriesea mexicana TaxID=516756 RepID=A0A310SGA7_9HYME|nr:hypothetical protein WN48_06715 [Eufriesea mexicana]
MSQRKRTRSCSDGSSKHLGVLIVLRRAGTRCASAAENMDTPLRKLPKGRSCKEQLQHPSSGGRRVSVQGGQQVFVDIKSEFKSICAETYIRTGTPRLGNRKLTFRGDGFDSSQTLGELQKNINTLGTANEISISMPSNFDEMEDPRVDREEETAVKFASNCGSTSDGSPFEREAEEEANVVELAIVSLQTPSRSKCRVV